MKNDKKASEIASLFVIENVSTENELIIREMLQKSAMEMAKWKDEEFEKRKKKIRDNLIKLLHSRGLMR